MSDLDEMTVSVNGEARRVPSDTTVRGLLDLVGIQGLAAVERNQEIVPRALHATTLLRPGDTLELVQLVGGG